jgi:hypothetical protein
VRPPAFVVLGFAVVVAFASVFSACGGKGGAMCGRATLDESMPGGCRAASRLLLCPADDGTACGCVTNEQSCPECPRFRGAGCFSACSNHEYAVECGSEPPADAGPVVVYDDPPPGCQLVGRGSVSLAAYCCPCE